MIPVALPLGATVRGMDGRTMGQVAYDGYRRASGNVSLISGTTLPDWAHQAPKIRAAWEAAAEAVIQERDAPGDFSSGVRF